MGFCFINNVLAAAAHAHERHGIDKVIVLDIDLHHGNGSQDIAWRLNDQLNNWRLLPDQVKVAKRQPLQIMYASLHDIYSYRAFTRFLLSLSLACARS